jgi:hypothetical protein
MRIIAAVFHRTRVPWPHDRGQLSSAWSRSSVHRQRFRGGDSAPGHPRFDLRLQMKENALQRLIDVWGTGEAAASLGFAPPGVRCAGPSEKVKEREFEERGIKTPRPEDPR